MPNKNTKFVCVNNKNVELLLTLGWSYEGEYKPSDNDKKWIRIIKDDTGQPGHFQPYRFEEAREQMDEQQ